jgi:hypothetical protein
MTTSGCRARRGARQYPDVPGANRGGAVRARACRRAGDWEDWDQHMRVFVLLAGGPDDFGMDPSPMSGPTCPVRFGAKPDVIARERATRRSGMRSFFPRRSPRGCGGRGLRGCGRWAIPGRRSSLPSARVRRCNAPSGRVGSFALRHAGRAVSSASSSPTTTTTGARYRWCGRARSTVPASARAAPRSSS